MSNEKKSQSTSIFNLKLKTTNRTVKPSKIEKIMKCLYEDKDHSDGLKENIKGYYSGDTISTGYGLFLTKPEESLNLMSKWNLRKNFNFSKSEDRKKIKEALSLHAGDVLPSNHEFNLILEYVNSVRPKTDASKMREIITEMYFKKEGGFPNKSDFIKALKENKVVESDLDIFNSLDFVSGNKLIIPKNIFTREQCLAGLELVKRNIQTNFEINLYKENLFCLSTYEDIQSEFIEIMKEVMNNPVFNVKSDTYEIKIRRAENFSIDQLLEKNTVGESANVKRNFLNLLQSFEMPSLLKSKLKEYIYSGGFEFRITSRSSDYNLIFSEEFKSFSLAFFKHIKENGAVFDRHAEKDSSNKDYFRYSFYLDSGLTKDLTSVLLEDVDKEMSQM